MMQAGSTPHAAHADETGAELRALIHAKQSNPQAIASLLDRLAEGDRIAATRALGPRDQKKLWHVVDGFRGVSLTDLVPPSTPAMTPVVHYGKNSMPLFTLFEKHFYRPAGQDPDAPRELAGANFQTISFLTGPGFYVVTPHPGSTCPEVDVDYRRVPSSKPDGWPAIVTNERGRARLVYGFTVDTLRRVSEHVTIGSAARHGKPISAYFVLCRQALP
jgi:hypothetical protein